jgi:hypothetical protein
VELISLSGRQDCQDERIEEMRTLLLGSWLFGGNAGSDGRKLMNLIM